jgi:hypothetical protein
MFIRDWRSGARVAGASVFVTRLKVGQGESSWWRRRHLVDPCRSHAVSTDPPKDLPAAPDASDVVSGPIGGASLRDPASSGPEGARLDRLPVIDAGAGEPDEAALAPGRPDDWSTGNEPNAAIRQLEAIIQNLTTFAAPVLREIAARAAELAAKAGEAAGPVAHKAAAVTEEVGGRLAVKGHEVASGLRGQRTEEPAPGEPVHPDESASLDGPSSP